MSDEEVEDFLAEKMKVQVATIGQDGVAAPDHALLRRRDGRSRSGPTAAARRSATSSVTRGSPAWSRTARTTSSCAASRSPARRSWSREYDGSARSASAVATRMVGATSFEELGDFGAHEVERQARKRIGVVVAPRPGGHLGPPEDGIRRLTAGDHGAGTRMNMMKIKVDFDLCESNALCEALAPDLFELDDDDFLQILKTDETTDENLEQRPAGGRRLPAAGDLAGGADACTRRPIPRRPRRRRHRRRCRPRPRRSPGPGRGRRQRRAQRPARCGRRGRRGDPRPRRRGRRRRRATWGSGPPPTPCSRRPLDELGRLDIVVNNAGITRDRMLFNLSDEEWDLVLKVHLRGHFLLSRNAAAYWRGAVEGDRRARLRPRRQHRLRGVPGRVARPGQLRRGQGRHRRADPVHRARAGRIGRHAPTRSARAPAPR